MKFSLRKARTVTGTHTCEHSRRATDLIQARYEERITDREQAQQARTDLIARVSRRYYLAHALSTNGNRHQSDMSHGIMYALAEITGIDTITLGYRLSHGLSLTDMSEFCVADNDGTLPVILREGTEAREPVAERLDRLHREALAADNHPMFHVLYGQSAA